jgi:hypothetical protein
MFNAIMLAKYSFEENALFYLHNKVIDYSLTTNSVTILKLLLKIQRYILVKGISYEDFYETFYDHYEAIDY